MHLKKVMDDINCVIHLPSTWFSVHSTSMVPPIIMGVYEWTRYLQSTAWKPKGLPLGEMYRCNLCLHVESDHFERRQQSSWPPKGGFTWSPKCQVPLMSTSPNMEAKSQLLSLKNPFKVWFISIKVGSLIFFMQFCFGTLCCELSLAFPSTQLSTQVPSLTSKKVLPCRHSLMSLLGT